MTFLSQKLNLGKSDFSHQSFLKSNAFKTNDNETPNQRDKNYNLRLLLINPKTKMSLFLIQNISTILNQQLKNCEILLKIKIRL